MLGVYLGKCNLAGNDWKEPRLVSLFGLGARMHLGCDMQAGEKILL